MRRAVVKQLVTVRGVVWGGHGSWWLFLLVLVGRACCFAGLLSGACTGRVQRLRGTSATNFAMPNKNLAEEKANFNGGACDERERRGACDELWRAPVARLTSALVRRFI